MFDSVPFSGSWGEVTHLNLEDDLIGEGLELGFEQAAPVFIAVTAVGVEIHYSAVAPGSYHEWTAMQWGIAVGMVYGALMYLPRTLQRLQP